MRITMHRTLLLLLCIAAWSVLSAENTEIGGPVSGTIFDTKAHALRPMVGVPGASYLGAALLSDLDAAAVSPDGSAGLAARGGSLLWVSGIKTTAPVVTAVDGAVDSPDRIAWSPNGSYAAVYSGRVRRAQVI